METMPELSQAAGKWQAGAARAALHVLDRPRTWRAAGSQAGARLALAGLLGSGPGARVAADLPRMEPAEHGAGLRPGERAGTADEPVLH